MNTAIVSEAGDEAGAGIEVPASQQAVEVQPNTDIAFPDMAWAAGVPNEIVTFCEGTYGITRAAHLEGLRRIRDALAPYGKFKEFCQAHGENYRHVQAALNRAYGNNSERPILENRTERQLSAPEPEPAEQTTLDDVSPYAAQVIESWEEKARQMERERDEAVKQVEKLRKQVARLQAGEAFEPRPEDFVGADKLPQPRVRAGSADYTDDEKREMREGVRWTVTRSVLSGIKAMAVPSGETLEQHAAWLFDEIPWDFLPNVRAEDFKSALQVLERWIAYIDNRTAGAA